MFLPDPSVSHRGEQSPVNKFSWMIAGVHCVAMMLGVLIGVEFTLGHGYLALATAAVTAICIAAMPTKK